ncbi:MAG: hypothetical protein ACSHYA_06895 [Opitutaceae bacterium]
MQKKFIKPEPTGDFLFEDVAWKEISPEEYIAKNWLRYGCLDTTNLEFENNELKMWADQASSIFNNLRKLEACRKKFLTDDELKEQAVHIEKIEQNGL